MGTTLTGTTPQDTYDSLIKVTDNGPLTGSLKKLTDGLGNDSSLSLSTAAASLSGSLAVTGGTQINNELVLATNNAAFRLYRDTGTCFFDWASGQDAAFSTVTSAGGAGRAEQMRLTSGGYLRMASGSLGIQFNGDTAAANALDDYEEGTWTPVVFGGTSGTATYTTRAGYYTKIGRQVVLQWFLTFQKATIVGNVGLGGLPFTVGNLGNQFTQSAILMDNLATAYVNPVVQLNNGTDSGFIIVNNGSIISHSAMQDTQLGLGDMTLRGTATYFV